VHVTVLDAVPAGRIELFSTSEENRPAPLMKIDFEFSRLVA
jgi:hypothetical protein